MVGRDFIIQRSSVTNAPDNAVQVSGVGPGSDVSSVQVPVLDTVADDVARTQSPVQVPDESLRCMACAVSFSDMEDLRNHFYDENDGASSPAKKKKRYAIPSLQCPATDCAGKPRMNRLFKHFKDSHPEIQWPEKIICVCGEEVPFNSQIYLVHYRGGDCSAIA